MANATHEFAWATRHEMSSRLLFRGINRTNGKDCVGSTGSRHASDRLAYPRAIRMPESMVLVTDRVSSASSLPLCVMDRPLHAKSVSASLLTTTTSLLIASYLCLISPDLVPPVPKHTIS